MRSGVGWHAVRGTAVARGKVVLGFTRHGPCEWCGMHADYLRGPHQSPHVDGPEGRFLRCDPCYQYLYRNGVERPSDLIERAVARGA